MVQGLEVDRPVNRSGDMEEAGAQRDDQLALAVADAENRLVVLVDWSRQVHPFQLPEVIVAGYEAAPTDPKAIVAMPEPQRAGPATVSGVGSRWSTFDRGAIGFGARPLAAGRLPCRLLAVNSRLD